jgi:hypothetical protein
MAYRTHTHVTAIFRQQALASCHSHCWLELRCCHGPIVLTRRWQSCARCSNDGGSSEVASPATLLDALPLDVSCEEAAHERIPCAIRINDLRHRHWRHLVKSHCAILSNDGWLCSLCDNLHRCQLSLRRDCMCHVHIAPSSFHCVVSAL